MKKLISSVSVLLLIIGISCTQWYSKKSIDGSKFTVAPLKQTQDTTIDISDLNHLNSKYIYDLVPTGIITENWTGAEKISPNFLTCFHLKTTKIKATSLNEEYLPSFPAEQVEKYIQQFFNVSKEHIRKANAYDKQKNIYHTWGKESIYMSRVTDAKLENNTMFINYQLYYSPLGPKDEQVDYKGLIKIELLPNDNYKYISCKVKHMF